MAGLGAVLALAALVAYLRRAPIIAGAFAMLAALVFYPALTAGAAPRLDRLWISPRAAARVAKDV